MKQKTTLLMVVIFVSICTLPAFLPNFTEAAISTEGYNFGETEVGSSKTTYVSISNLESNSVTLTSIVFAKTSCSDFSVATLPESMTIPSGGTVNVEIDYTPSAVEECADTLRIYSGSPFPDQVNFIGIGIEPVLTEPEPVDISRVLLLKAENILDFTKSCIKDGSLQGFGRGRSAEKRLRTFEKMMVVTYHLIDNGHLEAAHKKLKKIYKKIDGKPEPKDFVTGNKAAELASMVHQLIVSFDFKYKMVESSNKYNRKDK